jgi:divalent metal cation (Fe/Co/Zn/Cd) transporter
MASGMPIPLPPRTPTPPPDDVHSGEPGPSIDRDVYNPNTLSPVPRLHARNLSIDTMSSSSPPRSTHLTATTSSSIDSSGDALTSPFNFQPATLAKTSSTTVKSNIGQRRGHKYKHSSVSHAIFLEPPARAPLALPNSLPMPTWTELRTSLTAEQKVRFYWSLCHMSIAGYTAWHTHGSAGMQALSHLIFYDSLGALLVVCVDVFSNFEVWGKSSIRHPFGLQRMEVIAGFALSILLIFFGFDLISHNAKHALEGLGSHEPHHPHSHTHAPVGILDLTAALALAATLISAVALKNHARIGKAMRVAAMENLNLPPTLSNPSHFLTLSTSAILLVLPLLEAQHIYASIDKFLALTIALAMLALGVHLGKNVGAMLLMSFPGAADAVPDVLRAIEADSAVRGIDQAKFWQAHYGVGMANLRLKVSRAESEETLSKLRDRIQGLVRNRLGGGYGSGGGGQKWEVSVQFVGDEVKSHGVVGGYGQYLHAS